MASKITTLKGMMNHAVFGLLTIIAMRPKKNSQIMNFSKLSRIYYPWDQTSLVSITRKRRSSQILRVTAGGELSTVRPSDLTYARFEGLPYGAISLQTSFSLLAAALRGPLLNAPRSIVRTLVRVSACTLHYCAAIQTQLQNGLTWEVARHYNDAVLILPLEHNAAPRSRQAPPRVGFCRLGLA
jgi:hypothetical protein